LNRLSRAYERYRQTTDGRATAYSEREREFTFAKTDLRVYAMHWIDNNGYQRMTDYSILYSYKLRTDGC